MRARPETPRLVPVIRPGPSTLAGGMALTFRTLLASSDTAAFAVIFGIFVVALLVLIVITLRWVFRRDKAGRVAWRERQLAQQVDQPPNLPSAGRTQTPTTPPPAPDAPDR